MVHTNDIKLISKKNYYIFYKNFERLRLKMRSKAVLTIKDLFDAKYIWNKLNWNIHILSLQISLFILRQVL